MDDITEQWEQIIVKNISNRIFLVFDGLDATWDKDGWQTAQSIILGLLRAAEFTLQENHPKQIVRPIIFLRKDIFEILQFANKNQLEQNCCTHLLWNDRSLEKMLLRRINYYAQNKGIDEIVNINQLFDRNLRGNRETPFTYIMRRTMYRPRDVVAFMDETIKRARDNYKEDIFLLQSNNLLDAKEAYSNRLKNDLLDEWLTQKPELADYLEALSRLETHDFLPSELELKLKEVLNSEEIDIKEIITFLFDISVIGIYFDRNTWIYRCASNKRLRYNSNLKFRIHQGLRSVLDHNEV